MTSKLKALLSSVTEELKQIAATETIVGKSFALGDKCIVPVSRIIAGFGVGGNEGRSEKDGLGFGRGGAGGVMVEPVGFIVIDGNKVSFLPTCEGKFSGLIDSMPDFFENLKEKAKRKTRPEDGSDLEDATRKTGKCNS